MTGPAPFGLRRENGELVPEPSEVDTVRELFEAFLASGGRIKAAAMLLNEKGRRTRRGAPWSDTSVARVLRQEAVKPVVPEALWEGCQALLSGPAGPEARRGRRPAHLLGGVVRCGRNGCGGAMYLRGSGPAGKFTCQRCLAKIPAETTDRAFRASLKSVELAPEEVLAAFKESPEAAVLTRRLGGRGVTVDEVWADFGRQERRQFVDLWVAEIRVARDEITVVYADQAGVSGEPQSNMLPSQQSLIEERDSATDGGNGVSADVSTDPDDLPYLLTVGEAARMLRTTRSAVYTLVQRGALPGVTRIGRRLLVRRDDLVAWVERSRAPSPEEARR